MPLNSPTDKEPGTLYIVGTPIGNMDDITLRALKVLGQVHMVAAEDTRNTGKLLAHHNIKSKLVSYHEYNEREQALNLIKKIKAGYSVALVSDAGTPSVSDPGYRIIKEAIASSIRIIPVPGASASITALCASGLPTDSFFFAGFSPKKKGPRLTWLEKLAEEKCTIIFYESPKRILTFLEELTAKMGDRQCVVCREMTKRYEEFIRGSLSEVFDKLKQRDQVKGECTIVVSGQPEEEGAQEETQEEKMVDEIIKRLGESFDESGPKPSDLAKEIARKYRLSKQRVYDKIVDIKKGGLG
jgi:16S rRNA (cytidine1402-2'-O)-methyltransferase